MLEKRIMSFASIQAIIGATQNTIGKHCPPRKKSDMRFHSLQVTNDFFLYWSHQMSDLELARSILLRRSGRVIDVTGDNGSAGAIPCNSCRLRSTAPANT